jgi:hypothetical protein
VHQILRDVLAKCIGFRDRKVTIAKIPLPSLSPNKPSPSPTSSSSYNDVLPPSRREALAKVVGELSKNKPKDIKEEEIRRFILPMVADYKSSEGNRYTPTRLSVAEIIAIGDFPDYAELSGVPLPRPYLEHDINKALPRPYRPFRWSYHQTMCMLFIAVVINTITPLCADSFLILFFALRHSS